MNRLSLVHKRSFRETIAALSLRTKTALAPTVAMKTTRPSGPLSPGQRWGEFQIIRKLGEGGFGAVYHARDALDRDVALKLLDNADAIHEGRVLAQLRHPNIVAVYSYVQSQDGAALSMELIQGQSLEKLSAERGKLDPGYAALLCLHVCRGLALVHGKRLVHRDIKAGNVMRQADGRIVVVDFGLGQKVDPNNAYGQIAGTLPYMAPELFRGAPASPASDLYAVGVLLYFLLTQRHPIEANTVAEYRKAHEEGRKTHLLDVRPDLPDPFIAIVEKATHPDPHKRFKSAGAMAQELEEALHASRRRKKPLVLAAATLAAIGGIYSIWRFLPARSDALPQLELVRLTSEDGLSQEPSLSADGTLLTYSSDEAKPGSLDIWVRQVPNGASVRVTNDPYDKGTPVFSPDGHLVAFRSERDGGGAYIVPAFGGESKLLAKGGWMPRFSPDGKYISYWVGEGAHPRRPSGKIYVVPVSGGAPRQLAPQLADARNPVWAPDSRHLLFQGSTDPLLPPDDDAEWYLTTLDGSPPGNTGALKRFHAQGLEVHTYTAFWTPDYLVFSAARNANVNLWRARFPIGGKPGDAQRLTFGTAFESMPWVAPDGRIVFESRQGRLRIWRIALDRQDAPAERVTNTSDFDAFPSLSRDSKWLVFTRTSSQLGVRQLWIRDLVSGEESVLTADNQSKSYPVLSPAGDQVAYDTGERKNRAIYVIDRASREARRICQNCGVVTGWSPRGGSVLVSSEEGIGRLDLSSSAITPLLSRSGLLLEEAEWSPDQRWIAFSASEPAGDRKVFVAPSGSGEWQQVSPPGVWADKPHWSADGRSLYFYSGADGFPCIWSRAIGSKLALGVMKAVFHAHSSRLSALNISQPVRGFAVSGNTLILNLSENSASIWMGTPHSETEN
jgi:serine/threonine protein kinase